MEDCQIVELFFDRSEVSIKELSNKYGKLCLRVATNILNNVEDSEECINDAYLKVWNTIPPQSPDNLAAYVVKITRSTSIDRLKYNMRKKRNKNMDVLLSELDECIPSNEDITEDYDKQEVLNSINCFLRLLDDEMQVLFVRRYVQMESIESLSKTFHLSESNVSTKLYRVRNKLKIYLEKEGVLV